MDARTQWSIALTAFALGCESHPVAPCQVGFSDVSPYLAQLRPQGNLPADCPQGQQYQVLVANMYNKVGSVDPFTVVFQPLGSQVDPPSGAQALGKFDSYLVPSSGVCTIDTLTPAIDDSATPRNAPRTVAATTYVFSSMEVLADVAHLGNQVEARTVVDYGIPGCSGLEYVTQAVFPVTPCLNDLICLPDQIATDVLAPAGRGLGSGLSRDYRAFCNLDPALLDNEEVTSVLAYWYGIAVGRDAYEDRTNGSLHDVGICFLSEPFPSLCPAGSTLSTTGPCVVGPGSNPH